MDKFSWWLILNNFVFQLWYSISTLIDWSSCLVSNIQHTIIIANDDTHVYASNQQIDHFCCSF